MQQVGDSMQEVPTYQEEKMLFIDQICWTSGGCPTNSRAIHEEFTSVQGRRMRVAKEARSEISDIF